MIKFKKEGLVLFFGAKRPNSTLGVLKVSERYIPLTMQDIMTFPYLVAFISPNYYKYWKWKKSPNKDLVDIKETKFPSYVNWALSKYLNKV